jgi:hypothetical protein
MKSFDGNLLFASENMVNMLTLSRKDDLESLMYIFCFLLNGTLPVVDFINETLGNFEVSKFMNHLINYRQTNQNTYQAKIKTLLPASMSSAFTHVIGLGFKDKPDYGLTRFFM